MIPQSELNLPLDAESQQHTTVAKPISSCDEKNESDNWSNSKNYSKFKILLKNFVHSFPIFAKIQSGWFLSNGVSNTIYDTQLSLSYDKINKGFLKIIFIIIIFSFKYIREIIEMTSCWL
jgi:hypothetical protein